MLAHRLYGGLERAAAAVQGDGIAEGVGERARLARARLDQQQLRPAVGRGRAELGAGRDGGDEVDQVLDDRAPASGAQSPPRLATSPGTSTTT